MSNNLMQVGVYRAWFLLIAVTSLIMIGGPPGTSAQDGSRGHSVRVLMADGQLLDPYDESHALVIGVSRYNQGWRPLPGVERDVIAVSEVFKKQGFNVT